MVSIYVRKLYGLFILNHTMTKRREHRGNKKKSSYIYSIRKHKLQKEESDHQSILHEAVFVLVLEK